jgi:nucleoprotein TPR
LSFHHPHCLDSPLSLLSASVRDTVDDAAGLALINHNTMAAAAVDVGYLAASYSVPETTIQSLLSEPTIELVQSLLVQIESKAREFEDLQSEKLKADVELDNAVQSGEQRARTLKAAADKAQKEAAELRQKVAEEGA